MQAELIAAKAKRKAKKDRAQINQRYFKTGKGEYAEGDKFLGLAVPETRALAKEFRETPMEEALKLLQSDYHELRMLGLYIMIWQFKKGDEATKKRIYQLYLENTEHINNWDLVDTTAEHIVGAYLYGRSHSVLKKLAGSRSLWERRIAMLSCFHFIRKKEFETALVIAELLVDDKEDLIHKAVGWMLREIGERDQKSELEFLNRHYKTMPRTMLRYAIEKFEPGLRLKYLKG
jgi:3-methyladenine DNA glycosylase AlkD